MTTRRIDEIRDQSKPRVAARFTTPKKFRPATVPARHPVTDHALVRYFERVLGLDVEAIRLTILTDEQMAKAKALQTVELTLAPGIRAVVRGGVVVTIK